VIAVFVADDPVVDCVLVVAPAPVTSAIAKFIAKAPKNIEIAKAKIKCLIHPPMFCQHFQRLRACLNLELGSFAAFGNFFICPALRAQNDLRLFAALLPGLTLPVTAVFNLLPGLARLYAATPARVIPAPALVGLKFFLFLAGILSCLLATTFS
jgi:hypothetical protein